MHCLRTIFLLTILLIAACQDQINVDPATAREMISHRNLGLAYLEEGKPGEAVSEFQKLIEVAPHEPLGYANLGLAYLRLGKVEEATALLEKANGLSAEHPGIALLLAKVYDSSSRENEASELLEIALAANPEHVRTLYQLSRYYERSAEEQLVARSRAYLAQVVSAVPANIAARMQLVDQLLRAGEHAEALGHSETLRQILAVFPENAEALFLKSIDAMRNGDAAAAAVPARGFLNIMKPTTAYQAAINELLGKGGAIAGTPIQRFVFPVSTGQGGEKGLPNGVRFTDVTSGSGLQLAELVEGATGYPVFAAGDIDNDSDMDLFLARPSDNETSSSVTLLRNDGGEFNPFSDKLPEIKSAVILAATFADIDNDGKLDLVILTASGIRIFRNSAEDGFEDVSARADLNFKIESGDLAIADFDLEGDLDIFVSGDIGNRLYRNNLDGSFLDISDETGIGDADIDIKGQHTIFGDFDDDGDTDLLVANGVGRTAAFSNLRSSFFNETGDVGGFEGGAAAKVIASGDYNNDGYLDIFLGGDSHAAFYLNRGDGSFEADSAANEMLSPSTTIRHASFLDFDNDGYLDLLIGTAKEEAASLVLFYNAGDGKFMDASSLLPETDFTAAASLPLDFDSDGDLDLLLSTSGNQLRLLRNDGGNLNNSVTVRLAGLRTGSGKNNAFGIGSKVELKAGNLVQVRTMETPVAHFGIGDQEQADLVRVVWTNGVAQNHFRPEAVQTVMESQILKGSCPYLYAWNGKQFEFVTDVMWTSALGMPLGINGGERGYAFANSSRDYFKIPGQALQPKNGLYQLRFTSELWETSYLDELQLLTVDHPKDTEIYINEAFGPPPFPPLRVYSVRESHSPISAVTGSGKDVLKELQVQDGMYVNEMTPIDFQGIMQPHELILDPGPITQSDSLFLFLQGWIFPSDASINMNTAQSQRIRSQAPVIDVKDKSGNWVTAIPWFGFPRGKNKTVVVDLSGVFRSDDRRIRIRTNMQIYWDRAFFADEVNGPIHITSLDPGSANLAFRGYSRQHRSTPYSPHIPDYQDVSTGQKWRDLTGHYTRYGDVKPLLSDAENKYVIMNAGDEIQLQFPVADAPALADGWRRDFLLLSDGWVKDGDLNTAYGQTVAPLPFHGMSGYPLAEGEQYPQTDELKSYQRTFNTREVTTEAFRRELFDLR